MRSAKINVDPVDPACSVNRCLNDEYADVLNDVGPAGAVVVGTAAAWAC